MSKGKSRRVNPRRKPASEADVKRAKTDATDKSVRLAIVIFLTVLTDDFNFDHEQIQLAYARMNKLSQEIAEHRINLYDLLTVLSDEYGVDLK